MNPSTLTVLVVDDEPDTADSTAELLALNGFAVTAAYGGKAALRAVAGDLPDVVLLDLRMPGMDGHELAGRLAGRGPLLVAVTGCCGEEDRRMSEAAGIDLHLVKPVDPAVLVGLLGRYRQELLALRGMHPAAELVPAGMVGVA